MSDRAARPVAAGQILALDNLSFTIINPNAGCDSLLVLRKTFELGLPANLAPLAQQIIVQKPFVLALFKHKQEGVTTKTLAEVRQINFADDLSAFEHADFSGNYSLSNRFFCEPELFVDFKGASVNAERFGKRRYAFFFFNDNKINTVSG